MGTVLVTVISNQAGSYLAEQSRDGRHRVFGFLREGSAPCVVPDSIEYIEWDFTDVTASRERCLDTLAPFEDFASSTAQSREGLRDFLARAKTEGKTLVFPLSTLQSLHVGGRLV